MHCQKFILMLVCASEAYLINGYDNPSATLVRSQKKDIGEISFKF